MTTQPRPTPPSDDFHSGCFVCGGGHRSGLHLDCAADGNGGVRAVWQPSADFQSYPDRLHGGIIAALVDGAMVHALRAKGVDGVTAELNIRYLHSAALDRPLEIRATAEVLRHGLCRASALIRQDGRDIVKAAARFMAGRVAEL